MTGTAVTKKYDYLPLNRMEPERRDNLLRGALVMLAEDTPAIQVAEHYGISKTTLLAALNTYAEDEWKELQIARAQVAVQRAEQTRMKLAAQMSEYQVAEKNGEKTTETQMTYQRIREQLRLAEHAEKSAQWHLERLNKRIYGNSLAMTVEPKPFGSDFDANAMFEIAMNAVKNRQPDPPLSDAEKQAIVKVTNEHYEAWDAHMLYQITRTGAQYIGGKWTIPQKPIESTAEVVSVEITPQPPALEKPTGP